MSINWFEEKGNEGATAPSTSPVTSVIHLHCKQPVELRYSNEPGDDNTVFHDVFKTVCKHISEEHAELLKDTGVIVAGVNEDNHQHVVLLIGWAKDPSAEFDGGGHPAVLRPLFPLLEAPPSIRNFALNPTIDEIRSHKGAVVDIVHWAVPSERGEVFVQEFEKIDGHFKKIRSSRSLDSSADNPDNLLAGYRGWAHRTEKPVKDHLLLLWRRKLADKQAEKELEASSGYPSPEPEEGAPELFEQAFLRSQRTMESQGMTVERSLVHFCRYFPRAE